MVSLQERTLQSDVCFECRGIHSIEMARSSSTMYKYMTRYQESCYKEVRSGTKVCEGGANRCSRTVRLTEGRCNDRTLQSAVA